MGEWSPFAIALAVLAASAPAHAQDEEAPAAPEGRMESSGVEVRRLDAPLKFDHLIDGLPQSHILAVTQDASGYLWIGTQEGLARYDGYEFKIYESSDKKDSLSSDFVTDLAVDHKGRLWIGTDKGIDIHEPDSDSFEHINAESGLSSNTIHKLYQADGALWVLFGEGGLARIDLATKKVKDLSADLAYFYTAAATTDGALWLGTAENGVVKVNPKTYESEPLSGKGKLASKSITALHAGDGQLWIGTADAGLNRLDLKTGKVSTFQFDPSDHRSLSSNAVTFIFEDRDQQIWVGTRGGLNRFAPKKGGFVRYVASPSDPHSLPFNWLTTAFQDRGGVMWLGTFAKGLAKFDPLRMQFRYYRTGQTTLSFLQSDGILWVGTYSGLWKINRKSGEAKVYRELLGGDGNPISLDSTWISTILKDQDGLLWLTTNGRGIILFDPKIERATLITSATRSDLPGDSHMKIVEAPDGKLWIASLDGGLLSVDRENDKVIQHGEKSGMPSKQLFTLQFDAKKPKILWVGTADAGLVRYDTATNKAKHFDAETIGNPAILSILQQGSVLWLGTYAGLIRFDPKSGKRKIYGADVLGNETVYGVMADKSGRLWLTTNGGGLVVFNPKDESTQVYTADDGLFSDEFAQGGYYQNKSGEMFVGATTEGFNVFDPASVKPDKYAPPVVITRFLVADKPRSLEHAIDLDYTESVFSFEFSALAFAAPARNEYQYKLEGFDDEWRTTDAKRRFATYTNLDGGDYVFKLRGSNRHGVWTEKAMSIPVHVAPPPWKTWWAYAGYALLFALAVFAYTRYQHQRVSAAEKEARLTAVERDLELTAAVQQGFLPKLNQVNGNRFRLFGFYRAAEACSGDWWWHEQPAEGVHSILVGDVTGHGPGPAMVTAAVATACRVQTEVGRMTVPEKLDILNQEVLKVGEGKYHMTMCALELHEDTGKFLLYGAGSPPVLHLREKGRPRAVPCRGTPLGTRQFKAGTVEGQLKPGERMLLYTDGIPEISLPTGGLLGMRRFSKMFEQTRGLGLAEASEVLVRESDAARGDGVQEDDWTFTILEWS